MQFTPHSRQDWRDWLMKNHSKESMVYVVKHKKHVGHSYIPHLELMHEAICFGWIDTTVKTLDKDTYMVCFRKRTDKGRWSKNTLAYARKMIAEGLMTAAGMIRYKEGLKKPTIDHAYPTTTHPLLLKELKKNPAALKKFKSLSPSSFKIFNWWVYSAKTDETREKRIKATVQKCLEGKKNYMQK
jgi:uncharacterized protein YdeI (YjbR/CyaY-like superfamily)